MIFQPQGSYCFLNLHHFSSLSWSFKSCFSKAIIAFTVSYNGQACLCAVTHSSGVSSGCHPSTIPGFGLFSTWFCYCCPFVVGYSSFPIITALYCLPVKDQFGDHLLGCSHGSLCNSSLVYFVRSFNTSILTIVCPVLSHTETDCSAVLALGYLVMPNMVICARRQKDSIQQWTLACISVNVYHDGYIYVKTCIPFAETVKIYHQHVAHKMVFGLLYELIVFWIYYERCNLFSEVAVEIK